MIKIRFAFFAALLLVMHVGYAQPGTWTWMKGDSTVDSPGYNAGLGIPSPLNSPSSRYASGYWTDAAGNFWIYGGNNTLDDLWRFDPLTGEWTMMAGLDSYMPTYSTAGAYSAGNTPGELERGMLTWVTPDNHLWLYGGVNYSYPTTGSFLWQYDPGINQWAMMSQPVLANYGTKGLANAANSPGGRYEGNCAWTDSLGNLWLFGGNDYADKSYNDMWKYDVNAGIWTWMSGTSNPDDPGVYGTPGVASVNNYPPARSSNLFWKDSLGNFWLSTGFQIDSYFAYQDVWKFNPRSLQWTWLRGNPGSDTLGARGVNCDTAAANSFGPRYENRADWKACYDLVITMGGFPSWANQEYAISDLWAYKISTNQWIEINTWNAYGGFGTVGVASASNSPPARIGAVGFKDNANNLWMFGGYWLGGLYREGYANDLWKYVPDTTCVWCAAASPACVPDTPVVSANKTRICPSDTAMLCASAGYTTYLWNTGDTGICINATQAGDYYVTVSNTSGCLYNSNHFELTVLQPPPVSFNIRGDTLTAFFAVSYQWYLNDTLISGATDSIYMAIRSGTYSVQVTDTNGCNSISSGQLVNIKTVGIAGLKAALGLKLYPNPANNELNILYMLNDAAQIQISITDVTGRKVDDVMNGNQSPGDYVQQADISGFAPGVYFLNFMTDKGSVNLRFVKE